jgi:diketogulonate reductase-like aldo/keto reductase
MYGDDIQEELGAAVAAAVESGIPRKDIFVTTKIPCCPMHPNATFTDWCSQNAGSWNATANIERDYAKLNLSVVDLMLLHWPCETLEQTVATYAAIQKLKARAAF